MQRRGAPGAILARPYTPSTRSTANALRTQHSQPHAAAKPASAKRRRPLPKPWRRGRAADQRTGPAKDMPHTVPPLLLTMYQQGSHSTHMWCAANCETYELYRKSAVSSTGTPSSSISVIAMPTTNYLMADQLRSRRPPGRGTHNINRTALKSLWSRRGPMAHGLRTL